MTYSSIIYTSWDSEETYIYNFNPICLIDPKILDTPRATKSANIGVPLGSVSSNFWKFLILALIEEITNGFCG